MTELLNGEYEDTDGERKKLTREEVLNYINLLVGRRQRDHHPPDRVDGQDPRRAPGPAPERVAEDRELVPKVIEETLRYEAPSPVQARYVMHDVELHGQTVPQGSAMVVINGSGNRDDRKFADGDSFDIDRKIDHHLSFGYGIHFCLGAALARMEGRIALDEVLQRLPERVGGRLGQRRAGPHVHRPRLAVAPGVHQVSGLRTVVVGASSGLGRSIAVGLGQRGADVALLARRQDRLERAAKEAGDDALCPSCATCATRSRSTPPSPQAAEHARRDRRPRLRHRHR